jgi:hypothetical protein
MKSLYVMASESSPLTMVCQSTSTINYYIDDNIPYDYIQSKVNNIIDKNPWLGGVLVKHANNSVSIDYENVPRHNIFTHDASVMMDETLSYETIVSATSQYLVKCGNECLNTNESLFKVTLLRSTTGYALIVSLSHILGDGHTFYQIYSMLDKDIIPFSLIETRSNTYLESLPKYFDINELNWLGSKAFVIGTTFTSIFKKKPNIILKYINTNWIQTQKNNNITNNTSCNINNHNINGSFITTNDIITSWFFTLCQSDYAFMAINMRNRIDNLTLLHAGNYENIILYNKEDFGTPQLIHSSIHSNTSTTIGNNSNKDEDITHPQYKRAITNHVPSFYATCKCNCSLITNWCSLYKHINLSENSIQKLHLPLYSVHSMVLNDTLVLFKPTEHTMGCLLFTRNIDYKDINDRDKMGSDYIFGNNILGLVD